ALLLRNRSLRGEYAGDPASATRGEGGGLLGEVDDEFGAVERTRAADDGDVAGEAQDLRVRLEDRPLAGRVLVAGLEPDAAGRDDLPDVLEAALAEGHEHLVCPDSEVVARDDDVADEGRLGPHLVDGEGVGCHLDGTFRPHRAGGENERKQGCGEANHRAGVSRSMPAPGRWA